MRFFILFILCLFTYSQAAAVEVASSKSELQEMGIEIQLLSSIEGLPSCKIGGEINADIGKWLRLVRDGEAFAQTCVYEDWNISLTQTSGLSFYQVESSQDGKKLLSLLSDQGTTLHIFHTSGPRNFSHNSHLRKADRALPHDSPLHTQVQIKTAVALVQGNGAVLFIQGHHEGLVLTGFQGDFQHRICFLVIGQKLLPWIALSSAPFRVHVWAQVWRWCTVP